MGKLANRIQTVLDEMDGPERGKRVRLADIAGCVRGRVSQWLSGEDEAISYQHARKISEALGYNTDWLMYGREPKRAEPKNDTAPPSYLLAYVTVDEMGLLTAYRETNDEGRRYIRASAELQPKQTVASAIPLPGRSHKP